MTFAEDADITMRLLAAGWKVTGDRSMVAYTEAPETVYELLRQRYRWRRGIYQAFADNMLGLLTSPRGWAFQSPCSSQQSRSLWK